MSRLFKVLGFALTVVTLGIVSILAASCGSSGTQYRVFNAMSNPNPNPPNFDVTINGAIVTPAGGLAFQAVQPSSGYSGVGSGNATVAVYVAGQAGTAGAQPLVSSSVSMSGSNQYTLVLMGNAPSGGLTPWVVQAFQDNNTLPANGDIEIRVINAAPSLPGAVNIYIVPPPGSIVDATPTFTGLAYGQPSQSQGSEYATIPGGTYFVVVTTSEGTPLLKPFSFSQTDGIYTMMLTDYQNGFTFYPQPIPLTDMQ